MNALITILIQTVNSIFDYVSMFVSVLSDAAVLLSAGSGITLAIAAGALAYLPEGVRAIIRRWHGSIDEQFGNINNLVNHIMAHQEAWDFPDHLLLQLCQNRDQLQTLISKCRTPDASQTDRLLRSALLKSTVRLCLQQARPWAYGAFAIDKLTAEDVHLLGFLLPGETGGHHRRTAATDIRAEVKVRIVSEDVIRVVIDRSAGENAAQAAHGWPQGVKHALIVITAADGKTEVCRKFTTRLHNDIRMPAGSHGKQFIIQASFLKHIDDEPRFGNEPTFSMPLNTQDLAATLNRQAHEEFEAHVREVEKHRREVEN
jgi:hypothetical protein